MRFSVKGLLAAVTAVALGCAALLNANGVWAGVVYFAAFVSLCAAVLGIIYRRGPRQAFWIGFAIFGLAYALLIAANPTGQWARRTPMDGFLEWCHEKVVGKAELWLPPPADEPAVSLAIEWLGQQGGSVAGPATRPGRPSQADFKKVGHPLFLLVFAGVGGWLGSFFRAKSIKDGSRSE